MKEYLDRQPGTRGSEPTPGPWEVGYYESPGYERSLAVFPKPVLDWGAGHPICMVSPVHLKDDQDWANAYLLAAAPDLLEAAELALPLIETLHNSCRAKSPALSALREAIQKARGDR